MFQDGLHLGQGHGIHWSTASWQWGGPSWSVRMILIKRFYWEVIRNYCKAHPGIQLLGRKMSSLQAYRSVKMFIDVKYGRKGRVLKKEGLKMQCNVSGKSVYSGVGFKSKYLVLSPGEGHNTGPRHPVVQQVLREMILNTTTWDGTQEGVKIWTWFEIIWKIKIDTPRCWVFY